jgi:cation:H+ antiporter
VLIFTLALIVGLAALIWSADRFIAGASGIARYLGMSPLLIGMLIVGFGTSAPEMLVSAISALDGAPGIALGNAWGSNVANIGLILGISALVRPVVVQRRILRIEMPLLALVTVVAGFQLLDGTVSHLDAVMLLVGFLLFVVGSIVAGKRGAMPVPDLPEEAAQEAPPTLARALTELIGGMLLLVASSRAVVWGAVGIATAAGISDLVIGLTIIAVGTSLPELASSIAAARRGEDDIAIGNVIGSNLFNTLAVVGIAGAIRPFAVERVVVTRVLPVMAALTAAIFVIGFARRGRVGRITRVEGALLVAAYLAYMVWIATSVV